jgi:mono/diheme cytochrome c family protein
MRFLAVIGVLAIAVAIVGIVYFFGGFYDVAVANGGNAVVEWAVGRVSDASVDRHATAPPVPAWFNDAKTVQAGAREFAEEGCVRCHGAPGVKPEKFTQGMNPKPPNLAKASAPDEPGKVFWIVKHGIRMTGMPEFGSHAGDDEIWRAVAFVKHLGSVTPAEFKAWSGAGGAAGEPRASAAPTAAPAH